MCIKKEMIIKKSKSYRGFHQATVSESISQRKWKYEWNQKKQHVEDQLVRGRSIANCTAKCKPANINRNTK